MTRLINKHRERFCDLTPGDAVEFIGLIREKWPEILVTQPIDHQENFRLFKPDEMDFDLVREIRVGLWTERHDEWLTRPPPGIYPVMDFPNFPAQIRGNWREIDSVDLSTIFPMPDKKPIDWQGRCLSGGALSGFYYEEFDDERKFVNAVWRLSTRYMVNWLQEYDLLTGKPCGEPFRSNWYTGPESVKLCKNDPDFYHVVNHDPETQRWVGLKVVEPPES